MSSRSTYRYLEASEDSFPKVCRKCNTEYQSLEAFFNDTEEVSSGNGLSELAEAGDSNAVGVFRNCTCGSTMLVLCRDRRDLSPAGEERRKNFDMIVGALERMGMDRKDARTELRNFIRGDGSEILEKVGLRR